jgi:hypothetical protein
MRTHRLALIPLATLGLAVVAPSRPAAARNGSAFGELAAVTSAASAPPNLFTNSQFVANLAGWSHDDSFQWTPTDAGGDPTSGTAFGSRNEPVDTVASLSQCVPVTPGKSYVLTASALIPSGAHSTTRAIINLFYYRSTDCTGPAVATNGNFTRDVGVWRTVAAMAVAPVDARSAKAHLSVGGVLAARAYLDKASFREGKCVPTSDTLCLSGERFAVRATWKRTDGPSGPAKTVPFTADSGSFWFFDPSNIELNVKLLDACGFNGRYWVFASGSTNVEVTLTVIDTKTGAVKQYLNPQGKLFGTVADTIAFATCP